MAKVILEIEDINDQVSVSASFSPKIDRDGELTGAQRVGMHLASSVNELMGQAALKEVNGEKVTNAG